MSANTANLLYLVSIASFILSLRFLSSPRRARLGTWIGAFGMAWAIVVTLFNEEVVTGYWFIAVGMAIGAVIGVVGARTVKMTAMPQMVALFNGVGGGAAALISLVEFHGVWANVGDIGRRGCAMCDSVFLRRSSGRSRSRARWSRSPSCRSSFSGRPIDVSGTAGRQHAPVRGRRRRGRLGDGRRCEFWLCSRCAASSSRPRSACSSSCRSAAPTCPW